MARQTSTAAALDKKKGLSPEILERVRQRDSEAMGILFDTYFDRLYRLIFHLCGDHGTAEDVAQEAFLRIYRAAPTLDPNRDCWPWMTSIAMNRFRDLFRGAGHAARSSSVSLEDAPELRSQSESSDPLQHAVNSEQEEFVRQSLMELPEEQRQVVVLHVHGGLTHQQIATMTDNKAPATRKTFSRAMAKLSHRCKGLWDES